MATALITGALTTSPSRTGIRFHSWLLHSSLFRGLGFSVSSTYAMVRICEDDEWKTVFNTPTRHYEYLVMAFGLTNAPAVFQALVNDVLWDFLDKFVFIIYILIFSPDSKSHTIHVCQVLDRFLCNQLFVKAEKCEFHVSRVSSLGYVVGEGQIEIDPGKVRAVREWLIPTTRRKWQHFLCFTNFYRKFIRGFSFVASPLHALISSRVFFTWSPAADATF